jgi:hypothetical protein
MGVPGLQGWFLAFSAAPHVSARILGLLLGIYPSEGGMHTERLVVPCRLG